MKKRILYIIMAFEVIAMEGIIMAVVDEVKRKQLIFKKILMYTILNQFMQTSFQFKKNMVLTEETILKIAINQLPPLNHHGDKDRYFV